MLKPISASPAKNCAPATPLPTPKPRYKLSQFDFGKRLGKGRFGKVFLVKDKKKGYIYALKVISKKELIACRSEVYFKREVEIQSSLKHPHVLKVYDYFHDNKNVYILLEFAPKGELFKLLRDERKLAPHFACKIVVQTAAALRYCHANHVVHRDLKPENILLDMNQNVKLADFGGSVRSYNKRLSYCGTLDYISPQIVKQEPYSTETDMWSLGVLIYELLTGDTPFYDESRKRTIQRIYSQDLHIPEGLDASAADVIKKLLVKDPLNRLTMHEFIRHEWVAKFYPQAIELYPEMLEPLKTR